MDDILQAIAAELEEYSSLKVEYNPTEVNRDTGITTNYSRLIVTRVGCKNVMRIRMWGDQLRCRLSSKRNGLYTPVSGKGGNIPLAAPDAFEQLLAMLKRDLR